MADNSELKYAVEAVLFASERALTIEEIREAFDGAAGPSELQTALAELKTEYETMRRGFKLMELAGGYQVVTDPRFGEILKKFFQAREKKKLTPASLETLAIIAYKQPITKSDIEFIRGVNVEGPIKTLLEKNLIRLAGRKEVPGRPILYGTTKEFLDRFGLGSVKELPPLSEFKEKDLDQNLLPPELRYKEALENKDGLSEQEQQQEQPGQQQERSSEGSEPPAVIEEPSGEIQAEANDERQ